jgi:hypothetical protein
LIDFLEVNDVPIEPPADIEQYSNKPSNTGQSSPTLSEKQNPFMRHFMTMRIGVERSKHTFMLLFDVRVHVGGRDPT